MFTNHLCYLCDRRFLPVFPSVTESLRTIVVVVAAANDDDEDNDIGDDGDVT